MSRRASSPAKPGPAALGHAMGPRLAARVPREGNSATPPPTRARWALAILAAALPWLAGAVAAITFWLVRERHLYWGDALPLSINVPAGQAFHADEPLTLWLHHVLYTSGGGRWSAVAAIAAASGVAGGLWVALHARGFLRSGERP